jgi:hypothetical protein
MDYRGRNYTAYATNRAQKDIFDLIGNGAPTNGTSGTGVNVAGPGSTYYDYTNKVYYQNAGSKASPSWVVDGLVNVTGDVMVSAAGVSTLAAGQQVKATGSISAAAIVGTAAGQLGHANGVVLAAAPGASIGLMLIGFALHYTFATAAYTAGGNLTVNWGAGGAALTGLVSAANSVGAASSKSVMFYPLSTAGVAVVSNAGLNLVSSVAFTQPGTAAGTIFWELWYRQMAVGF